MALVLLKLLLSIRFNSKTLVFFFLNLVSQSETKRTGFHYYKKKVGLEVRPQTTEDLTNTGFDEINRKRGILS